LDEWVPQTVPPARWAHERRSGGGVVVTTVTVENEVVVCGQRGQVAAVVLRALHPSASDCVKDRRPGVSVGAGRHRHRGDGGVGKGRVQSTHPRGREARATRSPRCVIPCPHCPPTPLRSSARVHPRGREACATRSPRCVTRCVTRSPRCVRVCVCTTPVLVPLAPNGVSQVGWLGGWLWCH
jgi:hypothetical protein